MHVPRKWKSSLNLQQVPWWLLKPLGSYKLMLSDCSVAQLDAYQGGLCALDKHCMEDPQCRRDDNPDLVSQTFSNQLPGRILSFLDHQQSSLTLYCLCIEFNDTDWSRNVAAHWAKHTVSLAASLRFLCSGSVRAWLYEIPFLRLILHT